MANSETEQKTPEQEVKPPAKRGRKAGSTNKAVPVLTKAIAVWATDDSPFVFPVDKIEKITGAVNDQVAQCTINGVRVKHRINDVLEALGWEIIGVKKPD